MILERTIPTGYVDPRALSDARLAELVWAARWDSDIPNTPWGTVTHLLIRRHDDRMTDSWREKQRIKDELMGPERAAVEVFPARDDLVDEANMAHLWVLPVEFKLPFSL